MLREEAPPTLHGTIGHQTPTHFPVKCRNYACVSKAEVQFKTTYLHCDVYLDFCSYFIISKRGKLILEFKQNIWLAEKKNQENALEITLTVFQIEDKI